MPHELKPCRFLEPAYRDYVAFPAAVQDAMGYALQLAQEGGRANEAKPLKGFGGAGVLEIVENYDGDTYRAMYTVKLAGAIYVLHAFQKKSRSGRETPMQEIDLVKARLRQAEALHAELEAQ